MHIYKYSFIILLIYFSFNIACVLCFLDPRLRRSCYVYFSKIVWVFDFANTALCWLYIVIFIEAQIKLLSTALRQYVITSVNNKFYVCHLTIARAEWVYDVAKPKLLSLLKLYLDLHDSSLLQTAPQTTWKRSSYTDISRNHGLNLRSMSFWSLKLTLVIRSMIINGGIFESQDSHQDVGLITELPVNQLQITTSFYCWMQ